jgi:hypothetical protein
MRGRKGFLKILLIVILSGLFCAATVAVVPAGEVKTSCGSNGWYFAEGYTGGDFDTWILIQNPNQEEAVAHLRFFTPKGEPISMDLDLKGESRNTVLLNSVPGLEGQEVATEVICDGQGVVAERAMYFNYEGKAGGHASIGASSTSCCWYLPEGYTGGDFDTYVLLMNPNEEDAENVHLKLMKPGEGKYYMFKTSVAAGRRVTIKIDDLVWKDGEDNIIPASAVQTATGGGEEPPAEEVKFDSTDVSTYVYSSKPLVAERAMYFDYYGKAGGSSSIGAPNTAQEWYLPEGYTGGDFDTWVSAMNPSGDTLDITYTFYTNTPGFEPVSVTHAGVAPWSRDTIHVNDIPGLEGTDVATKVTATRPVELATVEDVQRYAVLYGVENYETDPLLYAVDDLTDIKHRLVNFCGFSYDNMRYRTDDCATVASLQEDMQWLAGEAGPEDIVVVFFGGKSSVDATSNYIDLYDGSVSVAELETYLSALQTQKLVGLLSCDNSGEMAEELNGSGRVLLASCSKGESSYEFPEADFTAASGDYGNGAFAYYLVEGLGKKAADGNGNGFVSAQEAFNYLDDKVTALVAAKNGQSQVPRMFDGTAGEVDLTVDKVAANIVAERSVYFKYGASAEGAASIGASSTYPNWFLAEGYTGGGFDTYVLVMNPYEFTQKVTAIFMTPDGNTIEKEYQVAPFNRLTIKVDDADPALASTDVSTRIEAEPVQTAGVKASCSQGGVVAERAMYFVYVDPEDGSSKAGGSCSIGYGSW